MSSYSCTIAECVTKKSCQSLGKEDIFIPFRLLVCGHSVCDLCLLNVCKLQKEFIKCTVCSFNTTIPEVVQKNVVQYEADIKRWLDPTSITAPEVLRFETNLFPLDFYQIGSGIYSGVLTATKTAEMIDLDLDDDSAPVVPTVQITTPTNAVNSLFEDDSIVKMVVSRLPKTAPEKFVQSVENGVKTFTELSQNHTSIKRTSDDTKEWFKKIRTNAREMIHRIHSILQNREKELLEQINAIEENRLQELKVVMNEILSKRSELKGKLLQSPQLVYDKDRQLLKKSIEKLVKDSVIPTIERPEMEFKFLYETSIESHLKKFGKVERQKPTVQTTGQQNGETNQSSETTVNVSSDEEEELEDVQNVSGDNTIDKEVVTILQVFSPNKFYVQKCSDKERFDILKEEIDRICTSPYYHSPAFDTLKQGEYLFAFSSKLKTWCRASLTLFRHEVNQQSRESRYLADVVLIDYGLNDTVQWFNIREKKVELFDERKWPPFAYNCSLPVKPKQKSSRNWDDSALELFKKYISNNQLVLIDFETKDGIKFVDLIHYEVPDVTTYQIPSLVEVMVKSDAATLVSEIEFSSYNRFSSNKSSKYPLPELPKKFKTISVLVQHVETPDLFYVLQERQHKSVLDLFEDLNKVYNNDNIGVYTYYCPKVNTPCAALFEGDNKWYRALITQKGKTSTEFIVQFVDFGNKQTVNHLNLRLLTDSFLELPVQAIPCGLIHVDPAYGFKWTENAIKGFRIAISNERGPQILTMCVYETKMFNQNMEKLLVVLRSYDGDNGIKINELMVRKKLAQSTGIHSQPDLGFDRNLGSSQESMNSIQSISSCVSDGPQIPISQKVTAFLVLRDIVERFELSHSDKRSSLIKVIVSAVKDPMEFYVQIDRPEVNKYFEDQEKDLHKTYSLNNFSGDINFEKDQLCAFKVNTNWRRGLIREKVEQLSGTEPEEPKYLIDDLDYGSEKVINVSAMRKLTDPKFTKDGAFALKCKLSSLRPAGGDQWALSAKDDFSDFVNKYKTDLFILVKGSVESEPISVVLFSRQTIIPGAFSKQRTVYESINKILIDKGLATYNRSEAVSDTQSDDDADINIDNPPKARTPMPFSLYSGNESILGSLQQRFTNDTNPHNLGQYFRYLKEVYPQEQTFFGVGTDLEAHPNEYNISFRYWYEQAVSQPSQVIETSIQNALNMRGELAAFEGPYSTGAACTAYFEFDKTWNRAEIIGITNSTNDPNNKHQMCVRFVDYGNQESILVDKLSSEVFGRETPKLALKCQLINIRPNSPEADKEIKNLIYTRVLDHKSKYFWENYPKLPMKVTVEIPEGEDYIPFIDFLESRNLTSFSCEDNESVDDIMNINPIIEKTFGLYPIVFQNERFYEVVMSFHVAANYAFFQATEVRQAIPRADQINHEHDQFLEMLQQMRAEVDRFPIVSNFVEGTPCLARYVDECWYRGLIVSSDSDEAQVFFVDHGNTDPISHRFIREIPKKYMKPRAHAFLCQVYNIRPPKDQMWSRCQPLIDKINNRLTDISSEEKMFARFKNTKYPLKIDLYRCDPNDQTVPGKHIFQDFVDKGLLEFSDIRDVWRKPIDTIPSYKSYKSVAIKSERLNK